LLVDIGGDPAMEVISEFFRPGVSEHSEYELARWSPSKQRYADVQGWRAAPYFIKALRHKQVGVRVAGAEQLGLLRERWAVPALIAALGDRKQAVRLRAAWALGKIGDGRAAEALRRVAARDADRDVRREAKAAIKQMNAGRATPR
jgi:HEAT repeat protein